jgi:hypothetical protein
LKIQAANIDAEQLVEELRRHRFDRDEPGDASVEEHAVKFRGVLSDLGAERQGAGQRGGIGRED